MVDAARFSDGASCRRIWLALKVGTATGIAGLVPLFDVADSVTMGFGAWAVVTVVVVMQPTLGATLSKGVQRLVGTVIAASTASIAGYGARHLLPPPFSLLFMVALLSVTTAALNFKSTAPANSTWAYAYLISSLTFAFLAIKAFHEQPMVACRM